MDRGYVVGGAEQVSDVAVRQRGKCGRDVRAHGRPIAVLPISVVLALLAGCGATAGERVGVLVTDIGRPVQHAGIGFQLGQAPSGIDSRFVDRLAIRVIRSRDAAHHPLVQRLGAIQVVGLDRQGLSSDSPRGRGSLRRRYAQEWQHWDEGLQTAVAERVRAFTTRGETNVIFDVWSQPNTSWSFRGTQQDFFEHYRRVHDLIRKIAPGYPITAPSAVVTAGLVPAPWFLSGEFIKDFLVYARDHDVLPDVVNWHDLSSDGLSERIDEIRTFMKDNGIEDRPIDIYGYVPSGATRHEPAVLVRYFAVFARAGVSRAAQSDWADGAHPSLGDTLTGDATHPRSSWWTFVRYSAFRGREVVVEPTDSADAVAAYDPSDGTIRMLVTSGPARRPAVELRGITGLPRYTKGRHIYVSIERIPNSGEAALDRLPAPDAKWRKLRDDDFVVTLPRTDGRDAFFVRLRPQR